MKQISDLTLEDIIARKNEARRERARLSFGQKVMIVEAMRRRLAPINDIRRRRLEDREAAKEPSSSLT